MSALPVLLLGAGVIAWLATRQASASSAAPSPAPAPSTCAQLESQAAQLGGTWLTQAGNTCVGKTDSVCQVVQAAIQKAAELKTALGGEACDLNKADISPKCQQWAQSFQTAVSALSGQFNSACAASPDHPVCATAKYYEPQIRALSAQWMAQCAPAPVAKTPINEVEDPPYYPTIEQALAAWSGLRS